METYLFCMHLSTAGIIIGWIGAVISVFGAIYNIVLLAAVDELLKRIAAENPDMDIEAARPIVIGVLVLCLVGVLINILTSVLLVVGTVKDRHFLLVPWLVNSGFSLLSNVALYFFVIYATIAGSAPFSSVGAGLIIWGLYICFLCYIWFTIMSLFKKIRIGSEQQEHLLPASHTPPSYGNL